MGDSFDGIRKTVGKVIHRIDAPLGTCSVVGYSLDAVEDRIPHQDVWRVHINSGAKDMGSILEFACPHTHKQVQVFFDGTVPVGAFPSRVYQGAPVLSYLI